MNAREIAWRLCEPDLNAKLQVRVKKALPTFAPWSVGQWVNAIRNTAAQLIEREGRRRS
jgi:hypothetical protein